VVLNLVKKEEESSKLEDDEYIRIGL